MANIGTSTKVPIMLTASHFRIESERIKDHYYNLWLKRNWSGKLRWTCDCPDAQYREKQRDPEGCKHVRRLREWIEEQRAAGTIHTKPAADNAIRQAEEVAAEAERQAQAQDEAKCLQAFIERQPAAEEAEPAPDTTAEIIENSMIKGFEKILVWLTECMEAHEATIKSVEAGLQSQIDHEHSYIEALQHQVCKHNEQFIEIERTIADKKKRQAQALDIMHRKLDEKTFQNNIEIAKLRDQLATQQQLFESEISNARADIAGLREALTQAQDKIGQLAQVEPVRLSAQQVVIDGPATTSPRRRSTPRKTTASEEPEAQETEQAPEIKKVATGYMIEGEKVIVSISGLVLGCSCDVGSNGKKCKHAKILEKHLAGK